MLNLLALFVVLFTDCSSPPPVAPPIVPFCEGTMNPSCLAACKATYTSEMNAAWTTYCLSSNAAWAQYEVDAHDCQAAYDTCVWSGGTNCAAVLNSCLDSATSDLAASLRTALARKHSMETDAKNNFNSCATACCQD